MMSNRHVITVSELDGFKPNTLVASGDASNGKRKRLIFEADFSNGEIVNLLLVQINGETVSTWSELSDAVNAYNNL